MVIGAEVDRGFFGQIHYDTSRFCPLRQLDITLAEWALTSRTEYSVELGTDFTRRMRKFHKGKSTEQSIAVNYRKI